MSCPQRSPTVHIEEMGEEVCLYDRQRRQVHALNPTAALVWQRCDGTTSPEGLAAALQENFAVPDNAAAALVEVALWDLARAHLITLPEPARPAPPAMARRDLLRRGVAVALLPVVHSIVAPSPAAAQSPGTVERFVDLGLIVQDTQTGLIWEKKMSDGDFLHFVDSGATWPLAMGSVLDQVNAEGGTGFAGFTDWRLPTLAELQSIVDVSFLPGPTIDPIFGPTRAWEYWSSSESGTDSAWAVSFVNGAPVERLKESFVLPFRYVRTGP
jgi:hypothetical protein